MGEFDEGHVYTTHRNSMTSSRDSDEMGNPISSLGGDGGGEGGGGGRGSGARRESAADLERMQVGRVGTHSNNMGPTPSTPMSTQYPAADDQNSA